MEDSRKPHFQAATPQVSAMITKIPDIVKHPRILRNNRFDTKYRMFAETTDNTQPHHPKE